MGAGGVATTRKHAVDIAQASSADQRQRSIAFLRQRGQKTVQPIRDDNVGGGWRQIEQGAIDIEEQRPRRIVNRWNRILHRLVRH